MRTLTEVLATARDESPFSNSDDGYAWMDNWCHRCHNPVEVAWQKYSEGKRKTQLAGYEGGCPLIMAAMIDKTPTEWLEGTDRFSDRYHCIEFRGPDDGGGEPRPKPDPPGMDGMFPRPERTARMLQQPDVHELVNS